MEALLKRVDFVFVRQADICALVMPGVFLLLAGEQRLRFVGDAQETLRGARDPVERHVVLALFRVDEFETADRQIERQRINAADARFAVGPFFYRLRVRHRLLARLKFKT